MWMPNVNITEEEEEETWELAQAFVEDTRGNTNWPPRSYSCTFCRREFRSAQALGGHMNVHRRERARLHQQAQAQAQPRSTTAGPTTLFCQLANFTEGNSLPVITTSSYYTNCNNKMQVTEMSHVATKFCHEKGAPIEEVDLELRLGYTITTPASHGKLFQKKNDDVSVINFR